MFITYMFVLGVRLSRDLKYSKYRSEITKLQNDREYERYIRRLKQEEERNKERERQLKRREYINTYKNKYTVYGDNLYPLLSGKSADVLFLNASDTNFIKNIPYGFRKDVYYDISSNTGEVIQWLNNETCLFMLKEREFNYYSYRYEKTATGLALMKFDSTTTNYPFDKLGFLYRYVGVYNYVTAMGSSNTIPIFEAVYKVGSLPKQ